MKFEVLIGTVLCLLSTTVLYGQKFEFLPNIQHGMLSPKLFILADAVKEFIRGVFAFIIHSIWGGSLMILLGVLAVRNQLNSDEAEKESGLYYYGWFGAVGLIGLGIFIVVKNITGEL